MPILINMMIAWQVVDLGAGLRIYSVGEGGPGTRTVIWNYDIMGFNGGRWGWQDDKEQEVMVTSGLVSSVTSLPPRDSWSSCLTTSVAMS